VPPVAVADSFTVNEGSTNTFNLAGNDSDTDDGLDLTSIAIVSGPANGTIDSINTNGTVTYTHNGSETLTDSFTYTIRDLAGATSNTVTVSLTVTPQNDAPIITSNGGGASAAISILSGNTNVTDVNASDAENATLTYSIIGGADAALFTIAPSTGVLTFITAPDFQAPGDAGANNIYDVIVQASDGSAVDTQALAVTLTHSPIVVLPPPPEPSPEPPPPPDDGDFDEEAPPIGVNIISQSHGVSSGVSQGATPEEIPNRDSLNKTTQHDLAMMQLFNGRKDLGDIASDLLDRLGNPPELSNFQSEIQALLRTSSGFLKDLDHVRDGLNNVIATEKTYVASSIAVSSGLSIGYVIWLLRSGVLLTALLSSVPAWQFVNPLLVLDSPVKKKRKKGQDDLEDDSLETMFEQPPQATATLEKPAPVTPKTRRLGWFRRTNT
ncbi:MAG: Ig-like domain-containing protein, partial [Nitrospirota bacterium]|nr:Ig-like domain-containing protein [Nitrospirota bacterium]